MYNNYYSQVLKSVGQAKNPNEIPGYLNLMTSDDYPNLYKDLIEIIEHSNDKHNLYDKPEHQKILLNTCKERINKLENNKKVIFKNLPLEKQLDTVLRLFNNPLFDGPFPSNHLDHLMLVGQIVPISFKDISVILPKLEEDGFITKDDDYIKNLYPKLNLNGKKYYVITFSGKYLLSSEGGYSGRLEKENKQKNDEQKRITDEQTQNDRLESMQKTNLFLTIIVSLTAIVVCVINYYQSSYERRQAEIAEKQYEIQTKEIERTKTAESLKEVVKKQQIQK